MDLAIATDSTALAELQAVHGILAGVTAALDEVERNLPPMACVWQGTARDAYAANLTQLFSQVTTMVSSIANAKAAIASAISAA